MSAQFLIDQTQQLIDDATDVAADLNGPALDQLADAAGDISGNLAAHFGDAATLFRDGDAAAAGQALDAAIGHAEDMLQRLRG